MAAADATPSLALVYDSHTDLKRYSLLIDQKALHARWATKVFTVPPKSQQPKGIIIAYGASRGARCFFYVVPRGGSGCNVARIVAFIGIFLTFAVRKLVGWAY